QAAAGRRGRGGELSDREQLRGRHAGSHADGAGVDRRDRGRRPGGGGPGRGRRVVPGGGLGLGGGRRGGGVGGFVRRAHGPVDGWGGESCVGRGLAVARARDAGV